MKLTLLISNRSTCFCCVLGCCFFNIMWGNSSKGQLMYMLLFLIEGKLNLKNAASILIGYLLQSTEKMKTGKSLVSFANHLKAYYLQTDYLVCKICITSTHIHQFSSFFIAFTHPLLLLLSDKVKNTCSSLNRAASHKNITFI